MAFSSGIDRSTDGSEGKGAAWDRHRIVRFALIRCVWLNHLFYFLQWPTLRMPSWHSEALRPTQLRDEASVIPNLS